MKTLQILSDESEIRALTHRYCDRYDRFDPEGYGGLFLPDGFLDATSIGFGVAVGPEAIAEVLRTYRPQQKHVIHMTTNHIVEITRPDTAVGSCYFHAISRLRNGGRGSFAGRYDDQYRRTADGWRFAGRVLNALLPPEAEGFDMAGE